MQLINALSESDKECDGQNITMYNNSADKQTQPILSTSSTPHSQHQPHKSCSNVGGSISSPPHAHDNTMYSSTQTPIKRHLTGNNLNQNPSGGVTPQKGVITSPEHRLVPAHVNTNEAVYHNRPLSAPAVALNAPAISSPFIDYSGSVRKAGRGGSKIISSNMRNENTTGNLQQPQEFKNVSEIYFSNCVELELDCLMPGGSVESHYDTLHSERDNKPLIDSYDENMNLSDTVNNNVFLSDVRTETVTTNEVILSPEVSSRTVHVSKYGTMSHNVFISNEVSSDINIYLKTVGDVNYDSTSDSGSPINCDEEKLSSYKNPPIWTSLALRDIQRNDASIIVPLPQHNMIKRVNVKCNHVFVPIHRPGLSESFHSTTLAACPCSEFSNRDTPNLEDAEVRVYFERRRFDELDQSPLIGNRFQTEQGTLSSNRFQTEQGTLSSNRFQTEQGTLSSNIFQTEQGTLSSNRFQTEQGTLSSNRFQTEQGTLSNNRFQTEQGTLSSNRFQTEQGTLSSNIFQTEQGTLSSNRFQTEQGTLSSNSFEFLHLGNNVSQTENFQLPCVPYSDLTYRMDSPSEPVLTYDGDILVGARIEFSPTLVNLQSFLRLLPTLRKCRDQLSDDLTPLYHDDDDDDWLSDEDELYFHETDGEFDSTLRPTNPVADVLCNGGSEHFLPVKQTNLDAVSFG